jgi:hypothetical protein
MHKWCTSFKQLRRKVLTIFSQCSRIHVRTYDEHTVAWVSKSSNWAQITVWTVLLISDMLMTSLFSSSIVVSYSFKFQTQKHTITSLQQAEHIPVLCIRAWLYNCFTLLLWLWMGDVSVVQQKWTDLYEINLEVINFFLIPFITVKFYGNECNLLV